MSTQQIVDVLGKLVVDDGKTLKDEQGSKALAVARQMEAALVPHLQEDEMHARIWRNFQKDPQERASYLVLAVDDLKKADATLASRLESLLAQYQRLIQPQVSQQIDTGGGAYIGGGVSVSGGDFVGRDKISGGRDVLIAQEHSHVTQTTQTGLGGEEVEALFQRALELANQKPPETREEVEAAVEMVKEETEAGEDADKSLLSKALDVLLEEGPDVLELVLEAILNPASAAGNGARMLAKHAKSSLNKRRKAR